MKLLIQLVLWAVIGFLGFKVYDSVYSSVRFQEVKEQRFSIAVQRLKEIRSAQLAHKTVTGKFASNYESLSQFIDTAKFTITQQRDSSFIRFNKSLKIDQSIDTVVVDILGYESIKDSLFKNTNTYKNFETLKIDDEHTAKITMNSGEVEKNEIAYPVFIAKVAKRELLYDQKEDLLVEEDNAKSLDEINGNTIFVGSMEEINTNGNWPIVYDK